MKTHLPSPERFNAIALTVLVVMIGASIALVYTQLINTAVFLTLLVVSCLLAAAIKVADHPASCAATQLSIKAALSVAIAVAIMG